MVEYTRGVRLRSQSLSNHSSGSRVKGAELTCARRELRPQSTLTFDTLLSPGSVTLWPSDPTLSCSTTHELLCVSVVCVFGFFMCFSLHFLTTEGREGWVWVGLAREVFLSGAHRVQEPGKVKLTQFIHLSSDMCCSWVMKHTCNTMQTLPFLYCLATQTNFAPPITAAGARTATAN